MTRRKAFLARPRLHVSRAMSSPVRPFVHAQVILKGPDGVRILLASVHTIDGSSSGHQIRGTADRRRAFKKTCLENVTVDMFRTRRTHPLLKDLAQQPVIMCCDDLNLDTNSVVAAVQDLSREIGTSFTVVCEGWGE